MMHDKLNELAKLMDQKYGHWLKGRFFEIKSRVDGPMLEISIILRNTDKSYFYPIESRILFKDFDMTLSAARDFLLDFSDSYIEEFLASDESTYLTIDWSTYDCDGVELQMRGQILNLKLESMASDLIESLEHRN